MDGWTLNARNELNFNPSGISLGAHHLRWFAYLDFECVLIWWWYVMYLTWLELQMIMLMKGEANENGRGNKFRGRVVWCFVRLLWLEWMNDEGVYCLFSSNKILSRPLSVCRDSIEIIFWSFHVLLSLPRVLAPGWVTDSLSQRKSIGQMNLVASFIWSLGKLIICLYILNFHSFSRFIMPWSVQAEGDWSFLTIFNRRWLVVMTIPNFMSN